MARETAGAVENVERVRQELRDGEVARALTAAVDERAVDEPAADDATDRDRTPPRLADRIKALAPHPHPQPPVDPSSPDARRLAPWHEPPIADAHVHAPATVAGAMPLPGGMTEASPAEPPAADVPRFPDPLPPPPQAVFAPSSTLLDLDQSVRALLSEFSAKDSAATPAAGAAPPDPEATVKALLALAAPARDQLPSVVRERPPLSTVTSAFAPPASAAREPGRLGFAIGFALAVLCGIALYVLLAG